jgi:hypothetical protein
LPCLKKWKAASMTAFFSEIPGKRLPRKTTFYR